MNLIYSTSFFFVCKSRSTIMIYLHRSKSLQISTNQLSVSSIARNYNFVTNGKHRQKKTCFFFLPIFNSDNSAPLEWLFWGRIPSLDSVAILTIRWTRNHSSKPLVTQVVLSEMRTNLLVVVVLEVKIQLCTDFPRIFPALSHCTDGISNQRKTGSKRTSEHNLSPPPGREMDLCSKEVGLADQTQIPPGVWWFWCDVPEVHLGWSAVRWRNGTRRDKNHTTSWKRFACSFVRRFSQGTWCSILSFAEVSCRLKLYRCIG